MGAYKRVNKSPPSPAKRDAKADAEAEAEAEAKEEEGARKKRLSLGAT